MSNKGFNNFDIVYYINLAHRTDRKEHITNELAKTGIDVNKINRVDAIYYEHFGELGCSLSHIKALEMFLQTPEDIQYCLIIEDDFHIRNQIDVVNQLLDKFFDIYKDDFDMFLISANIYISEKTDWEYIKKITDVQTTAGYCVNRKFAKILLDNFKEGAQLLQESGKKQHNLCLDQYWKRLQKEYKWYSTEPVIGEQMMSYSDIEKQVTYYRC